MPTRLEPRLEHWSSTRVATGLIVVSFVVLFQELALIRWMGAQVRALAYFPNLILIAAFLGLGLGCLAAGRRSLLWLWPVSLLALCGTTAWMNGVIFTQRSASEHLWLLYYNLPKDAPVIGNVEFPILVAFVLSAVSFVPLGQIVARRIQEFRVRSSALWGYSFDILGSLVGVIVFAVMGFVGTFPVHWFGLLMIAGAWFFLPAPGAGESASRGWTRSGVYAVAAIAVVVVVARAEFADAYSPYYALSLDRETDRGGIAVLANGSLHQRGLDLRRSTTPENEYQQVVRAGYHTPYGLLDRPPRTALVLGAGTGNDVATLLDHGVERVDVVEIDPVILEWGRRYHPSRPYDSPKVHLHNTDARSFLNRTDQRYDLIVFGTLDSMTQLSALANVRLDNFVYTLEAIEAARARLTPEGGMALYFMVGKEFLADRFWAMMTQAFGERPLVYDGHHALFNRIFLAGPAFAGAKERLAPPQTPESQRAADERLAGLDVPCDDWPFLYLQKRGVSGFYGGLMAAIGLLALGSVLLISPEFRSGLRGGRGIDVEMFLFGLAFLLLETRAVTEMNLVWGATWFSSAVVFGSILTMVLLATLLMQLKPLPYSVCGVALVVTLVVAWLFPVELLLGRGPVVRLVLSALVVGAPIFFASACFARLFAERDDAHRAFGWNLLGAVVGGLAEFTSMAVGLKALLLVALAGYLLAFLARRVRRTA